MLQYVVLPPDFTLSKYGISIRLVEVTDAAFIIDIRTDERNSRFISATSSDVAQQQKWIEAYKEREAQGLEYYFVILDQEGNPCATTRIYDFRGEAFETGSWVSKNDAPYGIAVKGEILGREVGFELLGFSLCTFNSRKANANIMKYHKMFGARCVREDEDNRYFEQTKEEFYKGSEKIIKLLG